MKNNIVRQKDIADSLNVSVNTVSHALRDMDDISEPLKERIRNKAVELGYVPNSLAVKLKTGKTKTIALVYDNLINPYFTIMVEKLFSLIKGKGYDTVIFPCNKYSIDAKNYSELLQLDVDGVLSFLDVDEQVLSNIEYNRIPTVLVGRLSKHNISSSYTDDFGGGALVGKYFKEKNYQKILYLYPEMIENSSRRYNGLISEFNQKNVISKTYSDEFEVGDILNDVANEGVEAVFCFNDVVATILKRHVEENGLKMEIVGFDSIHSELPFFESMTSIRYNFNDVAKNAVDILFDIIKEKNTDVRKIEVPVSLYIKGEA